MPEQSHEALDDLIERAQAGDVAAYRHVVEQSQAVVEATIREIMRDRAAAEDVAQETYLIAFRRLETLRVPGALTSWLTRIARNTALNWLRRNRHTAPAPVEVSAPPAPGDRERKLHRALAEAMVRLDPHERRMCERFYHGGWSAARLAEAESLTEPAVRKRLQRIRDKLRKEIEMSLEERDDSTRSSPNDLPKRIVELLSRPLLTDLPENPVGAVADAIRHALTGFEWVESQEVLALDDVESILGPEGMQHLPGYVHRVDDGQILRSEMDLPLLLAARGRTAPLALAGTGKVYRDSPVDRTHLQAFHQFDLLKVGAGVSDWALWEEVYPIVRLLLNDRPIRIESCDFPMTCCRSWEVFTDWAGDWTAIMAFGQTRPHVVERMGFDPANVSAAGLDFGLERIACLRYGIDDLRKVEAVRLAE
jgi:RNA polymerase sigma-70 factor, ECF subfamily